MTSKARILVIDDDTRLRSLLGRFLEENNFTVFLVKDTAEAKELIKNTIFDLLIVDVMLPVENGVDFTSELRKNNKTPIIMLTARGSADDRIRGLEVGANDYLAKPFEPKELLLRINNVLNYQGGNQKSENSCKFGDFTFGFNDLRLKKGDEFVHVTEGEAKILNILCKEKGNVVLREKLSEMCGDIDERSIDVQITRLRRKIETNPKQPHYLHTVRNRGYVLYD